MKSKNIILITALLFSLMLTGCLKKDEQKINSLNQNKQINENLVKQNPNLKTTNQNETNWYNKGITELKNQNYTKAIEYLQKVATTDKNYANSLDGIGIAYAKIKNIEDALKYFDKAIEIDSKNWEYYYNKANVLGENGYFNEAIKYLNKVLELNPNHQKSIDLKKYAESKIGK